MCFVGKGVSPEIMRNLFDIPAMPEYISGAPIPIFADTTDTDTFN